MKNTSFHKFTFFSVFTAILMVVGSLVSCETQDVYPGVSLHAQSEKLNTNAESTRIVVKLNGTVTEGISIPLVFSGTAKMNVHYQLSATEVVVLPGSDSGFVTLTSIQTSDTGKLNVLVSLGDANKFVPMSPNLVNIELVNLLADRDGDGVPDLQDDCPDEKGTAANNGCPWLGMIVNEVLYDPGTDLAGDANGDGVRDALADEFIEIFNSNPTTDISGYTLSDALQVRHTFPSGSVLPANGVLVVFGGGTPTGKFGNALVQVASTGQLNFTNSGDVITLKDAQGVTVVVCDINGLSANPDESYTRNPDIKGAFEQHSRIATAGGKFFSPGTKLNGNPF